MTQQAQKKGQAMKNALLVMDFTDPTAIREVEVISIYGDEAKVKIKGDLTTTVFVAFLFPPESRQEIEEVILKRQKLKAEYDQSMELVYQLRNRWGIDYRP